MIVLEGQASLQFVTQKQEVYIIVQGPAVATTGFFFSQSPLPFLLDAYVCVTKVPILYFPSGT